MITLEGNSLSFRFPELHENAKTEIQFQRTLRIPDNGKCYPLPPGLGTHLAYLTDGLGTHWEILANTYKPFPCGIVIHPLIEAALEIAQELNTAAEAVARVEIIANPAAMALCYRRHPKDEMEGLSAFTTGWQRLSRGARPASQRAPIKPSPILRSGPCVTA